MTTAGGRFDFDDGGTYCGGWEDGKAHGYGMCTGPKCQGEYAGAWHCGFEISGTYTWMSGNHYRGQWNQGKRHGVGVETKGRWVYHGEWTQGFKGRYGIRQSSLTGAKYEGTWTTGLQDGYGVETYADGGTYQGQWLRGIRHGYGVRQSVPYGLAAHARQKGAHRESLTSLRSEQEDDQVVKDRDRKVDEARGGFVLTAYSAAPGVEGTDQNRNRRGASVDNKSSLRRTLETLKLRKQRSTGDIRDASVSPAARRRPGPGGSVRSTISYGSTRSSSTGSGLVGSVQVGGGSQASFLSQDDVTDLNMVESYYGEWKNDRRSGFGVCERSDGLKYEGEWENNKKHGYGATTFRDGSREEGKYKNNVLVVSTSKSKLMILRASKLRDRVDNAVTAAQRAAQIALQKSDIAISRMASARSKAELAQQAAAKALSDAEKAREKAVEFAPEYFMPGADKKEANALPASKFPLPNHVTPSDTSNQSATTTAPIHPQPQSTARAFLTRVGLAEPPRQPGQAPKIGSALLSVGLLGATARPIDSAGNPVSKRSVALNSAPSPLTASTTGANFANAPLTQPLPPDNAAIEYHEEYEVSDYILTPEEEKLAAAGKPTKGRAERAAERRKKEAAASRFSTLLTPAVIADHFDQYDNASLASGSLASRDSSEKRRGKIPFDRKSDQGSNPSTANPISPAHVENPGNFQPTNRSLQRRKTLPPGNALPPDDIEPLRLDTLMENGDEFVHKTSAAPAATSPTSTVRSSRYSSEYPWYSTPGHLKENGQAGGFAASATSRSQVSNGRAGPTGAVTGGSNGAAMGSAKFPGGSTGASGASTGGSGVSRRPVVIRRGTLSPERSTDRGSLPDVRRGGASLMPREEVHYMSLMRREEIRREREEAERRKRQEIVVRLTDIKDWCQERQLLVLVVAVNISLAMIFFHIL